MFREILTEKNWKGRAETFFNSRTINFLWFKTNKLIFFKKEGSKCKLKGTQGGMIILYKSVPLAPPTVYAV